MSNPKTFAVEIWVSDCYLVTDIKAETPELAEAYALDLWEQGTACEPVENMQEVTSTHIEEQKS